MAAAAREIDAMTDIISAIDSATGCHQCGNPLGSSPSSDFCSEFCQGTWQANRIGAASTDPRAIPRYVTALEQMGLDHEASSAVDGLLTVWIRPDTRSLADGFRRMSEAIASISRGMSISASTVMDAMTALSESGKTLAAQRSLMEKALEARRSRGTGPAVSARAPRAINPRRGR